MTEAVWRASGSLKATGSTDEEALAQARFLVDGLTELAGRLPSATIQLGAYSDRDDDEATWRGTFSVVFPLRDAS